VNVEGLGGFGVINAKGARGLGTDDKSYSLSKVGNKLKLSSCMGIWEISRTTFSSRKATLTIPPSGCTTG